MVNVWIQALKEYNKGNGAWCLPRKGTKEYEKVRQIMDALKGVKTNKKQKEETNNKTPSKGRMEYLKKAKRQGLINELDDLLTSARYHFMSKQSLYKALKQILSIIDIYGDAGPTEGALKTEYNNAFNKINEQISKIKGERNKQKGKEIINSILQV